MNLQILKKNKWKFSPIPNIEESSFNKSLERFYDMGVNGLARENIQNSLDGSLLDYDGPVVLKIKTGNINKNEIPGIEEVKERILNLEGRNNYTNETIDHMKNKLDQDEVRYISFEDINTRGLTGARNGQSRSKKDTWGIYAYNKGVHFEEDNNEVEVSRGGSHGIGKIASNAASDLHVMYFANCDQNGEQHLGGTVQLIEHLHEGHAFRSTGYFTDIEVYENNSSKFYPYENHFHEVFKKDTRGLKIIIPYFRKEYDDERAIIKSICDSFFISILENKLEVHVNDKVVTKDTILNYVKDPDYYNQDIAETKKEFTPLYLNTYLSAPSEEIIVSNGEEDFHFNLYFRYDERIPKGRVAVVRTIGMKIEDFTVKSNATKPFNAVLIGGPKEDAYLKSLENESHTELTKDHFNDARLKRLATRFINNLSKTIAKVIEEAIKKNNKTDGLMDTKDILYVVETQFKKDLEKTMGTVKINKGKTLVKSSGKQSKKEKRGKREDKGQRVDNKKDLQKRKRDPLKWQKTNDEIDNKKDEGKERYSAHPEMVERIILNDKEMIKFDFTKSDQLGGAKVCDISLSIIDGMGTEYKDEFKIRDNYQDIIDMNAGKSCSYKKNFIKNVQIKDGVAQLKLQLKNTFNRSLKFVYYVEV
ncbi:hypothetical protein CUC15_19455 [Oceanobacillus zhaokaii]|uniref:Uncharacterized protein n=1 Tax=Oceanobacillus zhaokaii TaxID=2052660 RepID=A0A345PLU0_9BACI|nr:hypothetical protein [Oceanobacillus zhaokaii]AXI10970.1 hypothetical protein CUC15_19455 [Oceanobacillus zhaokaii]